MTGGLNSLRGLATFLVPPRTTKDLKSVIILLGIFILDYFLSESYGIFSSTLPTGSDGGYA